MDLFSALQIALRRWKIVVSIIVVTVIAAASAYLSAGAVYSAANYVVVVPTSVTSIPGGRFDDPAQAQADQAQRSALVSAGGARLVTSLLVTNLDSAQARQQFGQGPNATYTVADDAQLPVVTVSATGSDAAEVRALLGRVVDGSDGILAGLQTQAGIPSSSAYRAPRFTPDPVVSAAYPDRSKVIVAILVAGVALALLLAVALDGPLKRREQARAEKKAAADGGDVALESSTSTSTNGADGVHQRSPSVNPPGSRPRPQPQPQPIDQEAKPAAQDTDSRTERLRRPSSYPGR